MKISRKSSAFAAVILLAGLTLSACGEKDDSGDSSSHGTQEAALTEHTFAERITAAQGDSKTTHIEMTMGVSGQTITAKGDLEAGKTPADTSMAMVMEMGSAGNLEMRLVDEVLYMNFGQMTQNKFAKVDLTDESNPIGKQYAGLVDQIDPSRQMEQFGEALTSFEKEGEPEEIDGVEAQPYVVVVDTSKLPGLQGLTGSEAAQVPDTITYTMFIGPDDLPRRMVTDVAGTKLTMDYSKWGEDVDVEAPDDSEISDQDLSQLMSGALSG